MAHRRIKNPVLFICDIQDKFRPAIAHFPSVLNTAHKLLRASAILDIPVVNTTQLRAKLGQTCSELELDSTHKPRVLADVDKSAFSMWLPEVTAALEKHFSSPSLSSSAPAATATAASSSSSPSGGAPPAAAGDGQPGDKKPHRQSAADAAVASVASVARAFSTTLGSLSPAKYSVVIVGIEAHICVLQTALDALAAGHGVYVVADGVSSCNEHERQAAMHRLRQEGAKVTTSESLLYECVGDATDAAFKGIAGLVKDTKEQTKESVDLLCKSL